MSKEIAQSSDKVSQKSCPTSGLPSGLPSSKITKLTPRRYDIVDLLIVSLYNAIIFGAGFGLGWLLWVYAAI